MSIVLSVNLTSQQSTHYLYIYIYGVILTDKNVFFSPCVDLDTSVLRLLGCSSLLALSTNPPRVSSNFLSRPSLPIAWSSDPLPALLCASSGPNDDSEFLIASDLFGLECDAIPNRALVRTPYPWRMPRIHCPWNVPENRTPNVIVFYLFFSFSAFRPCARSYQHLFLHFFFYYYLLAV